MLGLAGSLLDVGAAAERRAVSPNEYDTRVPDLRKNFQQVFAHFEVKCVADLGPIQRDARHAVMQSQFDRHIARFCLRDSISSFE